MSDTSPQVLMGALRRWETIFTSQISHSLDVVSELTGRVGELESRVSQEAREKAMLRERQEHSELIQADLHRSKTEVESALRESERMRNETTSKLESEVMVLKGVLNEVQKSQHRDVTVAERHIEQLQQALDTQQTTHTQLRDRITSLETIVSENQRQLDAVDDLERSHDKASSEARMDAEVRIVELSRRIQSLEKTLIPSTKQYIDEAQGTLWSSTNADIQQLQNQISDLSAKLERLDSATAATSQSISEESQRAQRRAVDANNTMMEASLQRFAKLEAHIAQDQKAREETDARVQREIHRLTEQVRLAFVCMYVRVMKACT
jgi:DNA repair exonuclease SbcCD ATPase subunit